MMKKKYLIFFWKNAQIMPCGKNCSGNVDQYQTIHNG
jgi:hypothetical protein